MTDNGELALPARRPPAVHLRALAARAGKPRAETFWPKFWSAIGKVPFSEDLAAAWYCYADPRTPARVKAILAGALAYFVLPTDMLPDIVAGLGFTDDATVLATALGMVGAHMKRRHKQAARKLLNK